MEKILKIKGMHCKSCEMIVADAVNGIRGAKAIYVDSGKGEMKVSVENEGVVEKIAKAVAKEGYSLVK